MLLVNLHATYWLRNYDTLEVLLVKCNFLCIVNWLYEYTNIWKHIMNVILNFASATLCKGSFVLYIYVALPWQIITNNWQEIIAPFKYVHCNKKMYRHFDCSFFPPVFLLACYPTPLYHLLPRSRDSFRPRAGFLAFLLVNQCWSRYISFRHIISHLTHSYLRTAVYSINFSPSWPSIL